MKQLIFTGLAGIVASGVWAQQPNIIYIMTDQQTASALSCENASVVHTPNLDRLAHEGIRFSHAYCAAPLSGPSRFAMITGLPPGREGMLKNHTPFPEELKEQTLGNLLSKAGYECAYAGKWHLPEASLPTGDNGFGFRFLHGHDDRGLAKSCMAFLREHHPKPFFLVASFDNPHNICEYARNQQLPFAEIQDPPVEDCPNLPSNFAPTPYEAEIIRLEQKGHFPTYPVIDYTVDDWRRYLNAYYRLVETVDHEIGKIIDALVESGLYDQSVIIFSSDHGDGAASNRWNQKSALFEEVVNVPFIVKAPNRFRSNLVRPQLINAGLDLLPTICDYAAAEIPDHCTGKSIRRLIEQEDEQEIHPYIVTETLFDKSTTRGWMIRTPGHKYVLYDKGKYREQLFDMQQDRKERINLVVEKKDRDLLNRHRTILNEWIEMNNIVTSGREIIPPEKNHCQTIHKPTK
ncbi:MAG: sulfatase-like hydrolase/transferase [Proteiniphilum sp.]|nr:sulfatase-like hydrolase/transferase [Proteiniphilum sp.]